MQAKTFYIYMKYRVCIVNKHFPAETLATRIGHIIKPDESLDKQALLGRLTTLEDNVKANERH